MKPELVDKQKVLKENWFTCPTTRNLFIIMTVWVTGTGLLVLSITNFFEESFFNKSFLMIYIMMFTSTWTVFEVARNYFKKRNLTVPDSEKSSE